MVYFVSIIEVVQDDDLWNMFFYLLIVFLLLLSLFFKGVCLVFEFSKLLDDIVLREVDEGFNRGEFENILE